MTTRGMVLTFVVLFVLFFGSILFYNLQLPYLRGSASPTERWLILAIVGGLLSVIVAWFFTGAIAAALGTYSGPDVEGRGSSDSPPFGRD